VGRSLWTTAHVTQFTKPGWQFIDSASGLLGGDRVNGSYITLKSGADFSTVIETTRATASQTFSANVTGGLSTGAVHVRATNLKSNSSSDWFVAQTDLPGGSFSLTLQPGFVYTLSTVNTSGKGTAAGPAQRTLSLPYTDNFDSYSAPHEARYLADQDGSFEIAGCAGGRRGMCVRQMAPQEPIYWFGHAGFPWSILGVKAWRDYTVTADVLFEQANSSAALMGRFSARNYWEIGHHDGYYVRLTDSGQWSIVKNRTDGTVSTLASGTVAAPGTNTWHRIALTLNGSSLSAAIDGVTVGSGSDSQFTAGPAGLAVGLIDRGWHNVQFDNLAITPVGSHPPPSENLALNKPATGSAPCNANETPAKAVNGSLSGGNTDKFCTQVTGTKFLQVDLGSTQSITSFTVRHAGAGGESAALDTRDFDLQVSANGTSFTTVAQVRGNTTDVSTHTVNTSGRYVRMNVITPTQNGNAAARIYELEVRGDGTP
jgi:hypothetical protein